MYLGYPPPPPGGPAPAAVAMAVHYASFGLVGLNATLPICVALLYAILVYELRRLEWSLVVADLRNPMRTLRMIATQRLPLEKDMAQA